MDILQFKDLTTDSASEVYLIESASIEVPWSYNQILALADDNNAIARVGVIRDKAVCYYSLYTICGEGNINNLAVREEFRGKGYANALMQDMLQKAKQKGLSALTLEVNAGNVAAISLYEKFGFVIEGKRSKFYNMTDDALIMWKRNI